MTKLRKTTTPPLTNSNCASGRDYAADYERWKERMERKKVEDPEGYERLRRHTLDKRNETRHKRNAAKRALGIKPNAGRFQKYKEHILAYRKAHPTDWSEVYKRRKEKERLLKEQDPEAYAKIRESRKRSKKKYRGKVRAELAAKGTTEYALNRERIREYQNSYREKNRETINEKRREYDRKRRVSKGVTPHKEVRKMTDAELADLYATRRERERQRERNYREKNAESVRKWPSHSKSRTREYVKRSHMRRRMLCAIDADFYRLQLEMSRIENRRRVDKRGRKVAYVAKPALRNYDHIPFGVGQLDRGSTFIYENRADKMSCAHFAMFENHARKAEFA